FCREAGCNVPTESARRTVFRDRMWPSHGRNRHRTKNSDAVENSAVQKHLAKDREVVGSGKQASVACYSAHPKRSWVVDLPPQPLLSFGSGVRASVAEIIHLTATLFRGRDSCFQPRVGTKASVTHTERRKNISARELVEHQSAHAMHDLAERYVVDVAVNEARAWLRAQRLAVQTLHRFVVSTPSFPQIEIRSEASHVRQQVFDRDCIPPPTFHLRNKPHDRVA